MINEYGMQFGVFSGYPYTSAQGIQTNPFNTRLKKPFNLNNFMVRRDEWIMSLRRNIYNLLYSRFEWEGLPENMPEYYIEKMLVENGHALIFEREYEGLFVGSGSMEGLNHYGEPLRYNVVSPVAEMNRTYDLMKDKCVLVKNTVQAENDIYLVETYIKHLANIRVTQGINLETLKTPFILKGNEKIKRSLYEQFAQIASGQVYIAIDEKLANDPTRGVDVLDLKAPFHVDKLQEHYLEIESELLEALGVNTNPNPRKKERMISGEVETNQQEVKMSRVSRLRIREKAAERASEMFNREIKVRESEVFDDAVLNSINRIRHSIGIDTSVDEQGGDEQETY